MKQLLSILLASALLTGCASTIQLGDVRHDIGFLSLEQHKLKQSEVVELRQIGIGWFLGRNQTGVAVGYRQQSELSQLQTIRTIYPFKLFSKEFSDEHGHVHRMGFFWLKRPYRPLLINTKTLGLEFVGGKDDGVAIIGYQNRLKIRELPELENSYVCLTYSLSHPMQSEILITPAEEVSKLSLENCAAR